MYDVCMNPLIISADTEQLTVTVGARAGQEAKVGGRE